MASIAQYQRFDKDGLELVINTVTGESFATISGYARMSGLSQPAITQRINRSKGDNKSVGKKGETLSGIQFQGHNKATIKTAEVQTPGGMQSVRLIDEDTIAQWIIRDNPDLAFKMLKAGVRAFLHLSAGYQISSSATIIDHRLDPDWQKSRKEGIKGRLNLTDEVKAYIARHPELSDKEIFWIYAQHSDALNKGLYNRTAKQLKKILNIGNKALRNYFSEEEIAAIKNIEEIAAWFIYSMDMHPVKAINEVIELTQHSARFADRHHEPTLLKGTGKVKQPKQLPPNIGQLSLF